MLNSVEDIETAFLSTPLVENRFHALSVPDTDEHVFWTPISAENLLETWLTARSRVEQTGRWPIVVEPWDDLEDYLDRYDFRSEKLHQLNPTELQAKALETDVPACLKTWEQRAIESAAAWMETELEYTRVNYGRSPQASELAACQTHLELDKALMDWEESQGFGADPTIPRHVDWHTPSKPHLFLLPTPHSWATLTYMVWYEQKTLAYTALLKDWQERYGAELVCHYSTMLQFQVARPPQTVEAARELAIQHLLVAPCTLHLPGLTVREYTRALQGHATWFLHERP